MSESDFRIIYHEDGQQECAACGVKSGPSSQGQVALGQMGMGHSMECPNYKILLEQAFTLAGRRP